jgi:hypothetical protein
MKTKNQVEMMNTKKKMTLNKMTLSKSPRAEMMKKKKSS